MENISNSDNLFDWIFYINYYKDFKSKGINDKNSALIHWNSIGKYEGRLCNPTNLFDWEFYVNYYKDLKNNNIDNEDTASYHWDTNGKLEGRICNSYSIFDWEFYVDYYDDLKYIDSEYIAYEHWVNIGIYEDRISNIYSIFDWEFYVSYYSDLKLSNIKNEMIALNHWYLYGKKENRIYNYKNMFNWEFYVNYYNDLNINDEEQALYHWNNFGIYEERKYNIRCINIFSWEIYLKNYPELIENGINNEIDVINHYENIGKFENRIYNIYNTYIYNNNITDYIQKYCGKVDIDYIISKNNGIEIDLNFYKQANNIELYSKDDVLNNFYENGINGLIYHPKQLINIYNNIEIITFNELIYVKYDNLIYQLNKFVEKFVYNKSFDELNNILIKEKHNSLNENIPLLLIIFIGDEFIGDNLLEKIINYKKIEDFNIAICFNSNDIYQSLNFKIQNSFQYNVIYISNEFGNDIVPTLLMYYNIKKNYKFDHIIKLQTKTNNLIFNELTDFLLTKKVEELLKKKIKNSNCVGLDKYYMSLKEDSFNKDLVKKYTNNILHDNYFVVGTIFYCKPLIFDLIINFIKYNNYGAYLFNNMYDNNSIFQNNSYVHFLERLFGIIY
jgi:hypothetical protein